MTRSGHREQKPISTAQSRGLSWYCRSTSESLVAATRWSSSERPLFVRTVWVGGIRHAILSLDDPLLSQTSATTPHQKLSSATVSSTSDDAETSTSQEPVDYFQRKSINSEGKTYKGRTKDKRKMKKKYRCQAVHTPETEDSESDNVIDLTNAYDAPLPDPNSFSGEESRNALSERVFQWLDLANKLTASSKAGPNASRTSTKRINTALPTAYYLEPPNAQKHKSLLSKRLPRSSLLMALDTAPTQTEFETDVTPTRSSFQGEQGVSSVYSSTNGHIHNEGSLETIKQRSTSSTIHNRCPNLTDGSAISNFNQKIIKPRPVTAWTRNLPDMASKPQLHIFMPHLPHGRAASFDGSDCLSNSGFDQ